MTQATLKQEMAKAAVEQLVDYLSSRDSEITVDTVNRETFECRTELADGAFLAVVIARKESIATHVSVHYPNEINPAIALSWFGGKAQVALGSRGYGREAPIEIQALSDLVTRLREAAEAGHANGFTLKASSNPQPR